MRNLIVLVLFFVIILKSVYFCYRAKKETKKLYYKIKKETEEFRNKIEKETEEFRHMSKAKTEEMQRIVDLFLKDIEMFSNDDDFKKWRDRIWDRSIKGLYEIVLEENNNKEASDEFYTTLKEYEEWRTQKLR